MSVKLDDLLVEIRACRHCEAALPCPPRPVLSVAKGARILIIGQAPGIRVQESGVPWDDPSGVRLRDWMGISDEDFYDPSIVAIVPMGFCYPGTGKQGDLPPRPECAPLWHPRLEEHYDSVELTLLIGRYAQTSKLGKRNQSTLTATVEAWKKFTPKVVPLPHPSPRNNRWLKKNPWFESEVLPYLKRRTKKVLS